MNEKNAERDETPARARFHLVLNAVVSVSVLAVCLYGYTILGERKQPQRSKPPKSPVTIVETEVLRMHEGPVLIQTNGVAVPLREIRLATEVAGRIIKQSPHLRAGEIVENGEVLIELDPIEYQLEVDRLQAQLGQEAAEVAAVQVSIENTQQLLELAKQQVAIAKADSQRINALIQRQAASTTEADASKRNELNAASALVELENRRRELRAQAQLIAEKQSLTNVQLRRAKLDLKRCVVKSPLRGRVVTSSVEEQSFVSAGTSFVTIEDISAVEIRTQLTADQMVWVWRSRSWMDMQQSQDFPTDPNAERSNASTGVPPIPATITYKFGSESHTWPAVLQRIDGIGIDTQTRTYPCLFRVDAPDRSESVGNPKSLTRGMFVGVSLATRPDQTLYEVDETAIRPGNRVWLNVDGRLRVVPVTVVSRSSQGVVIELQNWPSESRSMVVDSPATTNGPATLSVIVSPISDPAEGMEVESARPSAAPMNRHAFVSSASFEVTTR